MQRLWPDPGEVADLATLVASEHRPAPAGRPWVLVNMVTALDGAIAVDGRSGGLAGPADKAMFAALRYVADVVLVGAGTARAERYGPPRPDDAMRAARQARGQPGAPRVALVSRSLNLDPTTALFAEAEEPPIVITSAAADPDRRAALADRAEVILAGNDQVDLADALSQLGRHGVDVVTCEGGPSLNGDLLAADLVDEWNLTVSPLLAGGGVGRASRGPYLGAPRTMRLARLLEDDDFLLTRWVRAPRPPT